MVVVVDEAASRPTERAKASVSVMEVQAGLASAVVKVVPYDCVPVAVDFPLRNDRDSGYQCLAY
jgi:hypothetical protein